MDLTPGDFILRKQQTTFSKLTMEGLIGQEENPYNITSDIFVTDYVVIIFSV
jgi:hypothetical protein